MYQRRVAILCILFVIVLVLSALSILKTVPQDNVASGPAIKISMPADVGSLLGAQGSIVSHVQVFSWVPSTQEETAIPLGGLDPTNNPFEDLLFEGTPDSNGVVSGNLGPRFADIDALWLQTISPLTQTVSMQVYATKTVTVNGQASVYATFDNIAFDPRAPPSTFSLTMAFAPTPTFTVPAATPSGSIPTVSIQRFPPPPCYSQFYWQLVNLTIIQNAPLPVAIGNLSAWSSSSAILTFGVSYSQGTLEFSFNSDTAYSSSGNVVSGVQMSSSPSWSGSDTSFQGFIQTDAVTPPNKLSAIVLNGANYEVDNYQWTYQYQNSLGQCVHISYDKYLNSAQITGMYSSQFTFATKSLPATFGGLWNYEKASWTNFYAITQVNGAGNTQLYQVMSTAAGYNTAQSAYNQVVNALSDLSVVIGTALMVADVLDLIPGAGNVATAAAAISILGTVAGDAAFAMSAISSISYSTTAKISVEMVGYGVPSGDPNMYCRYYESAVQTSISLSSGTYYPNMPMVYVVASQA